MQLDGLDHVAIAVRDIAESVAWYQRVLGLVRRHEAVLGDFPAVVGVGTTSLALFPVRTPNPSPAPGKDSLVIKHIAFRAGAAAFAVAQRHLEALGVAFHFQDHDIAHSIYLRDPDGHKIEITTYLHEV